MGSDRLYESQCYGWNCKRLEEVKAEMEKDKIVIIEKEKLKVVYVLAFAKRIKNTGSDKYYKLKSVLGVYRSYDAAFEDGKNAAKNFSGSNKVDVRTVNLTGAGSPAHATCLDVDDKDAVVIYQIPLKG